MKERPLSRILQDASAILGSLLPLAQLFFNQWVIAFDKVFLAKDQFLGVSLITLVLSYVLIIAYLTKPYGEVFMPFQSKKRKDTQEYWTKHNEYQQLISTYDAQDNIKGIEVTAKKLEKLKMPKKALSINSDNVVIVTVTIVIISVILFVALSFTKSAGPYVAAVQSVSYISLIASAAMMLTIYKKVSDNGSSWEQNNITRSERAIKLAIDSNGFIDLPQVKFLRQFEEGIGFGDFHVVAEYQGRKYEIITDREAKYLKQVLAEESTEANG